MRQATTQQPPATPGSPAVPPIPSRTGATTPAAIPQTRDELNALLARRSELSSQLGDARDRRDELASKIHAGTVGANLGVPQWRITRAEQRITSIESELADVNRALAAAPIGLVQSASTGVPARAGGLSPDQITGISIAFILAVMMPVAVGVMRLMLRRASRPPAPEVPREIAEGLARMEQRIDDVALEVERIGEGQRFVTQLLNDRAQRAAIPEAVPRR